MNKIERKAYCNKARKITYTDWEEKDKTVC